MTLYASVIDYKRDIWKLSRLQKREHILVQIGLRNLDSNIEHPNVMETQFTVITSEHIKLAFHYIRRVTAARSRSIVTSLYFLPVILLNIEDMHIIHPVRSIVPSKVIYLWVDQATSCGDSRTWFGASNLRFYPGKCWCVEVEDVIELSVLVWLSSKNVNLLLKSNGRVL